MTSLMLTVWLLMNICFKDESSIPISISLTISKYVDKLPSFCVNNLILVEMGPMSLFCSISNPADVDVLASLIV